LAWAFFEPIKVCKKIQEKISLVLSGYSEMLPGKTSLNHQAKALLIIGGTKPQG